MKLLSIIFFGGIILIYNLVLISSKDIQNKGSP